MSNVLPFPSQRETPAGPYTVFRKLPRPICERECCASLKIYPLNRAVSWRCLTCDGLIRSRGRLFIPHREIRACGIDPDLLPEVRRS
jgi:hypothetical protein